MQGSTHLVTMSFALLTYLLVHLTQILVWRIRQPGEQGVLPANRHTREITTRSAPLLQYNPLGNPLSDRRISPSTPTLQPTNQV